MEVRDLLNLLDSYLGAAVYFPFLLLGVGLFYTLYLGFPQIRYFFHAWKTMLGGQQKSGYEGDASHFQALCTALSGTVGTGNIGGVAFAIYLGGPAALFWMWMTAFVGMTTKFVEVSLSHKYRVKDEKGFISGGPMYYMERRLGMKWLAVLFAVATVISSFGTGNLPQSNNIVVGIESTFGIPVIYSGGLLALVMGAVILGGIRRIVQVTEKLVPIMGVVYLIGAIAVIIPNFSQIGPSFATIFGDLFTGTAATGGFLGASIAFAFNRGVNRGLFSNEAGQGSASIAHAAARTDEPVSEGMVSILEPFIDTITICTITGLVILSSGVWTEKFENDFQHFDLLVVAGSYSDEDPEQQRQLMHHLSNGSDRDQVKSYTGSLQVVEGRLITREVTLLHNRSIAEDSFFHLGGLPFDGTLEVVGGTFANRSIEIRGRSLVHSVTLTTKAFSRGLFGDNGQYIVSIALLLFGFSTAVAWSYYGDRAMTYLFGIRSVLPYRLLYLVGFFLASITDTSLVWLLSSITIAFMTIPNLFGIMLLHEEVKSNVRGYWERRTDRRG